MHNQNALRLCVCVVFFVIFKAFRECSLDLIVQPLSLITHSMLIGGYNKFSRIDNGIKMNESTYLVWISCLI